MKNLDDIDIKEFYHETVLLHEAVDTLSICASGLYVDATLGGGGHTSLILSRLTKGGRLFSFDQDQQAISNAEKRFATDISSGRLILIHANFDQLAKKLKELKITSIDGILYDLGVSSPQFDDSRRGFSYKLMAKLDMRMDQSQQLTAYDVVNTYSFQELQRIFYRYGEEAFAKQIARKIEHQRTVKPIETTTELAEIIKLALPQKVLKKKGHPAKRIFQAIRIEVNHELDAAESSFIQAIDLLNPKGRMAVITFHSLEDRLTKQLFKEKSEIDVPRGLPAIPDELRPSLKLITKKPIVASEKELKHNNRAHSAKLRVVEKQK